MTDVNQPTAFYLRELDILRFFAVLAVFIHHALPTLPDVYPILPELSAATVEAGGFGVDLFFALSAFLITELLVREEQKTGEINAKAFYARRALRIFPLYYVFVVLAIFVFPLLLENQSLDYPYNVGFLLFAANWTCAAFGMPPSVAAPLWSVSIEEQFYVTFPFVTKFAGTARLTTIAVGMLCIAAATRFLIITPETESEAVWCNTLARLDPIAVGILLSVLMRKRIVNVIQSKLLRGTMLSAAVAMYVSAAFFLSHGVSPSVIYPVTAAASGIVIWAFIKPQNANNEQKEKIGLLVYLGRISYGLYVFHLLGITLAQIAVLKTGLRGVSYISARFVLGIFLTGIIAWISYELLEKPFLMLKKRFTVIDSRPV